MNMLQLKLEPLMKIMSLICILSCTCLCIGQMCFIKTDIVKIRKVIISLINIKGSEKSVLMRRKTIKDFLLSKCKPGASLKVFFDAVGPFINNKFKSQ